MPLTRIVPQGSTLQYLFEKWTGVQSRFPALEEPDSYQSNSEGKPGLIEKFVQDAASFGYAKPLKEVPDNPYEVSLDDADFTKLVNAIYLDRPILASSTVLGAPDFQGIESLHKGLNCSAVVCRILWRPQNENDCQKLSTQIQGLINANLELNQKEMKVQDLADFLSMQDDDRDQFFDGYADSGKTLYKAFLNESKVKQYLRYIPYATGFLVGKRYLLTAHHVFQEIDVTQNSEINKFVAEFGYEKIINNEFQEETRTKTATYQFESIVLDGYGDHNEDPKKLDYALIKLDAKSEEEKAKSVDEETNLTNTSPRSTDFYITLYNNKSNLVAPPLSFERATKLDPNWERYLPDNSSNQENSGPPNKLHNSVVERLMRAKLLKESHNSNAPPGISGGSVLVIQHPLGQYKQIVLSNNQVIGMNDRFLYYEADNEHGSSGSPVFNQSWELVALHRAYLSENDLVFAYEGVRTYQIVDDLISQAEYNDEVRKFVDGFVNKPPAWAWGCKIDMA